MREKQHGGRQNTPVLVTFRITRPAAPDVLSQPSPARNIFHSPGNITSQWTQLLCTAHYTPPGAALKPEVLDVMWSNFRKRTYHCLYWVASLSTSCHKTNEEIFIVNQLQWVAWSIITNMKLRRNRASYYFHFCEVEGTPLLAAQQTLSTKHKNACVGSVECQRHRVRLDSVRVML